VLLVTHDLDEALYLASHIVLLEGGKVVANLPAENFSARKSRRCRAMCAPCIGARKR
jgi:ABC-type taurine transport system ATPase subunit